MSSDRPDIAIRARGLSKHYFMFRRPEDRLKQMLVPRLQRMLGAAPKQYFRPFAALENISFEIERGQTVGIVGRNGSGKSTLLQMICGTLNRTAGELEVNGRIAALLELGAGFNPDFSGRENVFLQGALIGMSKSEIRERFDSIAAFADIGDFIEQPVKTYSSGMYIRLAFAIAISVDPDILVVDEALAVGDEAFRRKCYVRLDEIRDAGATILFVSHGVQTIVQLCDRALLLDGGELLMDGDPKTVTTQYQKLLGVPPSDRAAAVQRIKSASANSMPVAQEPAAESPVTVQTPVAATAFFDHSLKCNPQTIESTDVAVIDTVNLFSPEGKRINVVVKGQRCLLHARAVFQSDGEDVSFSMSVRTEKGLKLFGATGLHDDNAAIASAAPGSAVVAAFNFLCSLNPGTYFVGLSVFRKTGRGFEIYNRVNDILVFRVIEAEPGNATGHFDASTIINIMPDVGPRSE